MRTALCLRAVVYGTDLSVCSHNAGLYSALLARQFSAKLLVVHAFTLSQAAMEVELHPSVVSQQREDLQVLLSKKASALASGSMEVSPLLLDGDPTEALTGTAEKYAPSLLVLGSHGGGWIERRLVGSVAEKVLRATRCAALTVGPQAPLTTSAASAFKRILFATDLSSTAAKTAAFAVSFAQAFGAQIDVLNVIEHGAVHRPDRLEEVQRRFYSAFDAVLPGRAKAFSDPKTFVAVGNAHEQILQHINEHSIDLLVLGIERTTPLGMGSKTSGAFRLIVDAECPVLTFPG
jgi:nucleotide-binding universal stress UspA family protein